MNTVIRKIGNSEGIIIPKEMLQKLGLKAGDEVKLKETESGLEIVGTTADLRAQLEAAREGMAKYRNALRELAK